MGPVRERCDDLLTLRGYTQLASMGDAVLASCAVASCNLLSPPLLCSKY